MRDSTFSRTRAGCSARRAANGFGLASTARARQSAVLGACLGAALPLAAAVRVATAAADQLQAPMVLAVTSCADSGNGTLRNALASMANYDTIDMTGLACSTITLSSALIVPQQVSNLTLAGPADHTLTISGNNNSRVLVHNGIGELLIDHLTLTNGSYTAGNHGGGCIYALGRLRVQNSTISNCTLNLGSSFYTNGGGIYTHGNLVLSDSVLSGNQAITGTGSSIGGGAFIGGNLTCARSTIRDNVATGPTGQSQAGGVFVAGSMQLDSCTITGNQAPSIGAAQTAGTVTCTNSTISGNSAANDHGGLLGQGSITLDHCTIAFNTQFAKFFGAGLFAGGTVLIANSSIIARNTSTQNGANYDLSLSNVSATFSGNHNLIMASNKNTPPNTVSDDPKLEPLADNGGPTLTHALQPDSPAIDKGDNIHGLPWDQRGVGYPRLDGAAPDIGAFETTDTIFVDGFQ